MPKLWHGGIQRRAFRWALARARVFPEVEASQHCPATRRSEDMPKQLPRSIWSAGKQQFKLILRQ
eukprot:7233029-Lingulodinium_polyedra.AAC.1